MRRAYTGALLSPLASSPPLFSPLLSLSLLSSLLLLSLLLLADFSTTAARGSTRRMQLCVLTDGGAMCFALGARGHSRGATEMPLSTSMCLVLEIVRIWPKKNRGGGTGGTYGIRLSESGNDLLAVSAAFWALVFLVGGLKQSVGWGVMNRGLHTSVFSPSSSSLALLSLPQYFSFPH